MRGLNGLHGRQRQLVQGQALRFGRCDDAARDVVGLAERQARGSRTSQSARSVAVE